jgi:hypothetical protein
MAKLSGRLERLERDERSRTPQEGDDNRAHLELAQRFERMAEGLSGTGPTDSLSQSPAEQIVTAALGMDPSRGSVFWNVVATGCRDWLRAQ